jgi:hypothetical protein
VQLRFITYNEKGIEQTTEWDVSPIDVEFQPRRASEEGNSVSNTSWGEPVALKASYVVTIGAGTLRAESAKKNLLRLIAAQKVLWKFQSGSTTEWRDFAVEFEEKIVFDYLNDRRSLPKIKLTFVERKARFANSFEKFIDEASRIWQSL